MPYTYFTDDQKLRAGDVDLERFLLSQGEELIRSGPEKRLKRDHSVTVRGNEWYDHATKEGGGPVTFVQRFYDLSYPEAMSMLLNGERGQPYQRAEPKQEKPRQPFQLPPANGDMRRVYAYLMQQRFISRDIITAFAKAGLIYEDAEHHNAVFVGNDEHGVAHHAHKRSVNSFGKTFRINVEGCQPQYSFHWNGTSDCLYVFEAPIDMLSFITLYSKDWQKHSYVALCGTSDNALLWMLKQNPQLKKVALCLDHDPAGIEASGQHIDVLRERGYTQVIALRSQQKDWNEDLKALHGLEAIPAQEHPQLIVADLVCQRVMKTLPMAKGNQAAVQIPGLIAQYQASLHRDRPDQAMGWMEHASALALAAARREYRQIGRDLSPEQLESALRRRIKPHRNRSGLNSRARDIEAELQGVLAKSAGIHTAEEKRQTASAWLDLAASCAMVPVKYAAEELIQQQKQAQEQAQAPPTMGLAMC